VFFVEGKARVSFREFDGYKGHITEDPDSEIITNTANNAGGASVAEDLIEDLLDNHDNDETVNGDASPDELKAKVDGDAAYGTDEFQQRLGDEGIESGCRTQPPTAPSRRPHPRAGSPKTSSTSISKPTRSPAQTRSP
jgi:hypothetical protein